MEADTHPFVRKCLYCEEDGHVSMDCPQLVADRACPHCEAAPDSAPGGRYVTTRQLLAIVANGIVLGLALPGMLDGMFAIMGL